MCQCYKTLLPSKPTEKWVFFMEKWGYLLKNFTLKILSWNFSILTEKISVLRKKMLITLAPDWNEMKLGRNGRLSELWQLPISCAPITGQNSITGQKTGRLSGYECNIKLYKNYIKLDKRERERREQKTSHCNIIKFYKNYES